MTKLIILTIFGLILLHCLLGDLEEPLVDQELPELLLASGQLEDLLPGLTQDLKKIEILNANTASLDFPMFQLNSSLLASLQTCLFVHHF